MRFQFCGHVNCPQWFIAEISVLTKITAVKMKLIFTQLITYLLENVDITPKVAKLLNGTGLDQYQMHSVIATLKFILQNSITFNVSEYTLNKQLIDLGLPRQNVESITKTFKSNKQKLLTKASQNILKKTGQIKLKHSVHELIASQKIGLLKNISNISKKQTSFAQIQLEKKDEINKNVVNQNFITTLQQMDYLIFQIQNALQMVQKLQKNDQKRSQQQIIYSNQ